MQCHTALGHIVNHIISIFHSCTVHLDIIKGFLSPADSKQCGRHTPARTW